MQITALTINTEKLSAADKAKVNEILDRLELEGWDIVMDASEEVLSWITRDGVYKALFQIGMTEEGITAQMSEKALEYARNRAAELVGKRITRDGRVIDNPNAEWRIDASTREYLRADVTRAVEEGWSTGRLRDTLESNYAFSEDRAEMIARTEIAFADSRGNMIAYQESGVVGGKKWILGSEHEDDDECDANAAEDVIPIDQAFQSGDMEPPLHPRCVCDCIPILTEEMEDE